ncbi:solute carrier organic anion transporter family member 4A1 [Aplysia californica]|uniref:Solute carrier organic anion transporter family member n=1 Tax=Aplysia californica TaxID=6500 RepID=A0ABM1A9S0_APLCA|nr:solute carrier organic anion transporter family member 4A1 [Aplysia californica]
MTIMQVKERPEEDRLNGRSLPHGEGVEPEGNCGCFSFQPRCLQRCNNIRVMVIFQCIFAFIEGFLVNGVINVIILPLETRYRLSSKLSGLIASGNDFGAFVVLLFIGHVAEQRNKPRFMAGGVAVMAVGSLVFCLPHFLSGAYQHTSHGPMTTGQENVCINSTDQGSNVTCSMQGETGEDSEHSNMALYSFFLIGQVLLGIGSSPMFTIGLTYVDENSKAKMTSLYTGLIMCSAAVGVAAGYMVAGQTLGIYVDVDKIDVSQISLTPEDPRWVGAWWIGVVISMVALIFIAVPFAAYPKRLPGYNALLSSRKTEAHGTKDIQLHAARYRGTLREFPKAILGLLKNPTFVLLCLAGCCEALVVSGTATFGAKLFRELFHVNITKAGMFMGVITVPGAGGGMLLGGYVVKKLQLRCAGIIKLCGLVTGLSLLLAPSFLTRCPDVVFAGVSEPYPSDPGHPSLNSPCNSHCSCSTEAMEPLCVGGRLAYFSPCHAGCGAVPGNLTQAFEDCTCMAERSKEYGNISQSAHAWSSVGPENATHGNNSLSWELLDVRPGTCAEDCPWIYVFSVLCFLIMLCTFFTLTPNITAVMRCVRHDERSFAVSLQILSARLIGSTPGPVLFGAILDSTCLTWQEGCSSTGSCWLYDRSSLSVRIVAWWISLKLLAVLLYTLAFKIYKPPPEADSSASDDSDL